MNPAVSKQFRARICSLVFSHGAPNMLLCLQTRSFIFFPNGSLPGVLVCLHFVDLQRLLLEPFHFFQKCSVMIDSHTYMLK